MTTTATYSRVIRPYSTPNRTRNHNLEEQALFKVTEFLNKMSNSGAPKSLAQICDRITDGSHFSPKDCEESNIPMLSVKDMSTFGFDYHDCKHISKTDFELMRKNGCVPHAGDILIAKDGSYLKEIFMCREEIDQAILSSIAIFRANTTQVHPELLLYILKQPAILQAVKDNYVSGSALPRIVLKDFKKLTIMLPEAKEQEDIGQYLSYVSSTIFNLCKQNENLMKQRDTLLPKLISGAITC